MNPLDFISRLFRGGDVKKNAKALAKQEAQKRSSQGINKTLK
ncbi:MAG: hypothetical protein O2798_03185 [Chloroflexi bacterium]|nr:hypothetical protein [Chloroflexota bacterium]MDA1239827.1 hypothetical protein [Chloroflexota bacterium]